MSYDFETCFKTLRRNLSKMFLSQGLQPEVERFPFDPFWSQYFYNGRPPPQIPKQEFSSLRWRAETIQQSQLSVDVLTQERPKVA